MQFLASLTAPTLLWSISSALGPLPKQAYVWECFNDVYTRAGCCQNKDNQSCWIGNVTYDYCCSAFNAAPFAFEPLVKLFPMENEIPPSRELLHRCVENILWDPVDLTQHPGSPFHPAYNLVDDNGHVDTLGRVLSCAGALPTVNRVLDLFLGRGGMAFHVLQGLRRTGGGILMGFEMNEETIKVAHNTLAPALLDVVLNNTYSFRERILKLPDVAQTVLLHGKTYTTSCSYCQDFVRGIQQAMLECFHFCPLVWSPVDAVCELLEPDLVLWDGPPSAGIEWIIIERVCAPRYVLLMNVSLPEHAAWIVQRLRALGWGVVAEGVAGWGPAHRLSDQRDYFRVRSWMLLERLWEPYAPPEAAS